VSQGEEATAKGAYGCNTLFAGTYATTVHQCSPEHTSCKKAEATVGGNDDPG
jgi:hypothetical protein